ncbi:DEAD/DEAH box helicase [Pseudoclavibacter chungangensis]|uniref:DEAD/DEAH box helicase n=1 Tax=Pseudoclavibacter chungangensis TaxID=587635 RepID=A0A7J5C448_9MICO|nr:DEAD/DEAH box helicase [Pseudoclavibacter chungangensis]NYJ68604.1 superfamily II DNA/RNA helicase [Pseudoclavibacter chungangensis]
MPKRKGSGGFKAPKHYVPRDRSGAPQRAARDGGARRDEEPRGDRARRSAARDARGRRTGQRSDEPRRESVRRDTRSPRDAGRGRDDERRSGDRHANDRAPQASPFREDVVLARLESTPLTPEQTAGVTFPDLGVGPNLVDTLADLGAETPFPIQVAAIPDAIAGRDVLGRGRTGSGKTIAFAVAVVERLMTVRAPGAEGRKRAIGRAPRALIVAPTRELALQIDRTVQPLARSVGLFTTQVYGGVPQSRQVTGLKRGVDIVIGTPGRIEDLERQGHLDLSQVVVTVLDEADQMTDLGFLEPIQRILRKVKPGGQRMLFSATLDSAVLRIVDEFLVDPAVHEIADDDAAHSGIEHRVLVVDRGDRDAVLQQLAGSGGRVLVFTRTRLGAEKVVGELADGGVKAVALHGDLSQIRRSRNLADLAQGKVDVLVATDVAARGIHVDDVRLVVQADMPDEYKTYLHRSGRTGRAGHRGTVVTLIPPSRRKRMSELLERAEIDAPMLPARPGGRELDEFMS